MKIRYVRFVGHTVGFVDHETPVSAVEFYHPGSTYAVYALCFLKETPKQSVKALIASLAEKMLLRGVMPDAISILQYSARVWSKLECQLSIKDDRVVCERYASHPLKDGSLAAACDFVAMHGFVIPAEVRAKASVTI